MQFFAHCRKTRYNKYMNISTQESLSLFSLIPLIAGACVAGVALVIIFTGPPDYTTLLWEEFLKIIIPGYFVAVTFFSVCNAIFLLKKIKKASISRNLFYTIAGFFLAAIIFISWINI